MTAGVNHSKSTRLVILTLVAGAAAWWLWLPVVRFTVPRFSGTNWGFMWRDVAIQGAIVLTAFALACVPQIRSTLLATIDWVKTPSPPARRWTALALASAAYLYGTSVRQGRILLPMWHDELAYRLQTQMLSRGRLWMSQHPLAQFFEAPYVFVKPVYAAKYFPGTALLHVPAVWLGLPYWLTPIAIAAISVALLYLIITELLDGAAGLLAALLLVSCVVFRQLATMEMSNSAALMESLLVIWAWLAWRRTLHLRWIIFGGAAAGLFAITRPLDAICAAGPVAVVWLVDLIRRVDRRRAMLNIVAALLAAAPFLALQLIFDRGVTGHFLQTPAGVYDAKYFQSPGLGFPKADPNFLPPTPLLQFRAMYKKFFWPEMRDYTPTEALWRLWSRRLPIIAATVVPSTLLVVLLPVGLLGLSDNRRRAMAAVIPLYLIGMIFYYFFLMHYCALLLGAAILLVLLGGRVIEQTWNPRRIFSAAMPLMILGLAIYGLPEVNRGPDETPNSMTVMQANYELIPRQVREPAIVLFTFNTYWNFEEPVYNWDVALPDDAKIIRAHDLGAAKNQELFDYYAQRDPDRNVYVFDRARMQLRALGNVRNLAKR